MRRHQHSRLTRFLDSCDRLVHLFENQDDFNRTMHNLNDPIKATALLRARVHAGNGANFKQAYDRHYVGLKGEQAFSQAFNEPLVLWDQPGGDHGEDFWILLFAEDDKPENFSVDVKTSRQGRAIIVPKGKVRADLYVLARYDDASDAAQLLGWQWGSVVRNSPTKQFSEECHFCTTIRPLADLAFNALWLWNDDGPPTIPEEWKAVHLVRSH